MGRKAETTRKMVKARKVVTSRKMVRPRKAETSRKMVRARKAETSRKMVRTPSTKRVGIRRLNEPSSLDAIKDPKILTTSYEMFHTWIALYVCASTARF